MRVRGALILLILSLLTGLTGAESPLSAARAAFAAGDYQRVTEVLAPLPAAQRSVSGGTLLARSWQRLGRDAEALAAVQAVLVLDPNVVAAQRLAAELAEAGGDLGAAIQHRREALRLSREGVEARQLGRLLALQGELHEAVTLLTTALAEDAGDLAACRLLGRLLLAERQFARAEPYLHRAAEGGVDQELLRELLQAALGQERLLGPVFPVPRQPDGGPGPGLLAVASQPEGPGLLAIGADSGLALALRILADFPNDSEALAVAARGWLALGQETRARPLAARLRELAPAHAATIDLSLELAERSGDGAGFVDLLATAVTTDLAPELLARRGIRLAARLRASDPGAARDLLVELDRRWPGRADCLRLLAMTAGDLGEIELLRQSLARLDDLHPERGGDPAWRRRLVTQVLEPTP